MGEKTGIAWTDHTFNIAWGCFKISPGCKNCYADTFATNRVGLKVFGPPATTPRRTFGEKHWQEPLKWNRQAEREGRRHRAFSSSMCDIGEDHPTIAEERKKLWPLIKATPFIDWQLLSKRDWGTPGILPDDWGDGYPNVWLGASVENQEYADIRIPKLLDVPARVRFLSVEPLLGPIDFSMNPCGQVVDACDECGHRRPNPACDACVDAPPALDWVIVGGESGPGYRPMDHAWARSLRDQCVAGGTAFFMKQSAAIRTEMGTYLEEVDGSRWAWKQYPRTPYNPAGEFAPPALMEAA